MRALLFITLIIKLCFINSYIHNPKNFLICNKLNCPRERGVCTRDNKCVCTGDYVTVSNEAYGEYRCNYLAANQAKVFILEFLVGFGVGHFYLGHFVLAGIKFAFCLGTAIIVAISPCLNTNQMKGKKYSCLMVVLGLIFIMWQAIDGILIALNFYKDRNGVSMHSNML